MSHVQNWEILRNFPSKLMALCPLLPPKLKTLGLYLIQNLVVPYLDCIIPKAYSLLAFIRQNSKEFSDPCTLKLLYTTLVRSRLDYACFIWNHFYLSHTNRLKRVQSKFLRFALRPLNFSEPFPSYHSRYLPLKPKSLESRRIFCLYFLFLKFLMVAYYYYY